MSELENQFTDLQNKKIAGESPRGFLLEEVINISKELYVSLFLNRSARCYSLIVSAAGGMDVEAAENRVILDVTTKDNILEIAIKIAGMVDLDVEHRHKFVEFVQKIYSLCT